MVETYSTYVVCGYCQKVDKIDIPKGTKREDYDISNRECKKCGIKEMRYT